MMEAAWLTATRPEHMFILVQHKATARKRRLFTCACCRRIAHLLPDKRSRQELENVERNADVGLSKKKHEAAWVAIIAACIDDPQPPLAVRAVLSAKVGGWGGASSYARHAAEENDACAREAEIQCRLFRDIFGNPLRPSTVIDLAWLSWNNGTVARLAQAIYDDRAFDLLPILADALEDAGCTNADILDHCRGRGEHVRGCWVVDLLLAKE
jgi:hypothetical protein